MARNHARILTSIWNDIDFLALDSAAQRVYLMLLSQQNLSHAGLLPLTVKRWANKAVDTTAEQIEAALTTLVETLFVVVDEATEELLIRSFIRGDEVYKQPNVLAAACTDAKAIASFELRTVLAAEIIRIRHFEGLTGRVIQLLETLSEALPEPFPMGSPRATGMGKGTEVSREPAPTPSPTPATGPAAIAAVPDDPTDAILREHIAAYDQPPPPSAVVPVRREVMRLVAEHVEPSRILAGLARMRDKRLAASLLPQLVSETGPAKSTTDQRVAAGAELVRIYQERGE
jgi:hypothetical protein